MIPDPLREYDRCQPSPHVRSLRIAPHDGAASVTGIDLRRLPWIRPLVGRLRSTVTITSPRSTPAIRRPPRRGATPSRARRRARATPRRLPPSSWRSRNAAARRPRRARPPRSLADPRTVVVATGQQAGAFGGPLYTLLKAVTAIQLARRASADHKTTVVPVFWVDAEDHDWQEVRSCIVLDADFQPRTVALAAARRGGRAPGRRVDAGRAHRAEPRRARGAPVPAPISPTWMLRSLRAAYRPGTGMAAAFATWIESLLGPHGLVVFESADPAAKRLAAPVFVRELRNRRDGPRRSPRRPASS